MIRREISGNELFFPWSDKDQSSFSFVYVCSGTGGFWESLPTISHLRCAHKCSWKSANCCNRLLAHSWPMFDPDSKTQAGFSPKHPRQGWGAGVLWGMVPKDCSHPTWHGGSRVLFCAGWTEMTQISALEHNFRICVFPNKTYWFTSLSLLRISMLGMPP